MKLWRIIVILFGGLILGSCSMSVISDSNINWLGNGLTKEQVFNTIKVEPISSKSLKYKGPKREAKRYTLDDKYDITIHPDFLEKVDSDSTTVRIEFQRYNYTVAIHLTPVPGASTTQPGMAMDPVTQMNNYDKTPEYEPYLLIYIDGKLRGWGLHSELYKKYGLQLDKQIDY